MWKQLIEKLTPDCEFEPPALWAEVTLAEEQLGIKFPDTLRNVLFETNGVQDQYGSGLIWPLERIVADNMSFRANENFKDLYMPFDSLLFFADAGNGDQFTFAIQNGAIHRADVFAWNHEDDSRFWVAPSLAKYLEWWLDGTIKL
jgi:cell wall assembly regulator SMI1